MLAALMTPMIIAKLAIMAMRVKRCMTVANMSIFVRIMYQFVSALAQKVIWILIVFIMFLALA